MSKNTQRSRLSAKAKQQQEQQGMKPLMYVGVIIVVLVIAGIIALIVSKLQSGNSAGGTSSDMITTADGLQYKDVVVGTGAEAKTGSHVTVNYIGTLTDGTKFDSSYDRNQPFPFTIGQGMVIKGWDEGIVGMKVGGKRHLVIPPALGYGAAGAPPTIQPNETLIFDVELLSVQ